PALSGPDNTRSTRHDFPGGKVIPIRYNLRSLMVRRATSVMTASVVALVVMLLFILSGFVAGLRATVMGNALTDNWIVLSRGTANEGGSFISREQYEIITLLRGVYPIAYQVHRDMRLESGRWPNRGTAEMVVGRKLAARFHNLAVGSDFKFGRRTFKIVGIFSDHDSARESEVLTDLDILTQDIHVANGFEVLHVVLKPGTQADFAKSLTTDSRVKVDTMSEQEFYAKQTEFVDQLRVLGFSRFNVLASFVIESTVLALAGGVLGEILGLLVAYSTGLAGQLMNVGEFIFRFRLTAGAFVSGMIAAIAIGALGGLLPAWRASRLGLVESLRSV